MIRCPTDPLPSMLGGCSAGVFVCLCGSAVLWCVCLCVLAVSSECVCVCVHQQQKQLCLRCVQSLLTVLLVEASLCLHAVVAGGQERQLLFSTQCCVRDVTVQRFPLMVPPYRLGLPCCRSLWIFDCVHTITHVRTFVCQSTHKQVWAVGGQPVVTTGMQAYLSHVRSQG